VTRALSIPQKEGGSRREKVAGGRRKNLRPVGNVQEEKVDEKGRRGKTRRNVRGQVPEWKPLEMRTAFDGKKGGVSRRWERKGIPKKVLERKKKRGCGLPRVGKTTFWTRLQEEINRPQYERRET